MPHDELVSREDIAERGAYTLVNTGIAFSPQLYPEAIIRLIGFLIPNVGVNVGKGDRNQVGAT